MNSLSGREENMMEKIKCRDGPGEMRDREKRRGATGRDEMQREKGRKGEGGCRCWFRLEIIYSLFYIFKVMVEPVRFIPVQMVLGI